MPVACSVVTTGTVGGAVAVGVGDGVAMGSACAPPPVEGAAVVNDCTALVVVPWLFVADTEYQ